MSRLEALRSWRYANVQPTATALQAAARQLTQRWYRDRGGASTPARASLAKRPASMAGVCTVAMLLLVVPLFTLEADARGRFGGHRGGFGRRRGGEAFGAPGLGRGCWEGPARHVARFA